MEVVVERGWQGADLDAVLARSEVDREEFERHFLDLRDCCTQICIDNAQQFEAVVLSEGDHDVPWRDRLRATAYSTARYLQERSVETRFDAIHMVEVSELARAYRDRMMARIFKLIDDGRYEVADPDSVSPDVAAGVLGSIYQLLIRTLGEEDPAADIVERVVPDLMYVAVLPYLGEEAAREELKLSAPNPSG